MSYCRFSTPNCDLYCYESTSNCYQTYVAAYRERKWKVIYHKITDKKIYMGSGFYIKRPRWGYLWWLPHWLTHKRIGLPYDGEDFQDDTLYGFYDRVKWLAQMGYRVPDYLYDEILNEIKELKS